MGACLDAVRAQGVRIEEVTLVGGGAKWACARSLSPSLLGVPVRVPPADEYVAIGAARQAAWVLAGGEEPPAWRIDDVESLSAEPDPRVRAAYEEAAALAVQRFAP